MKEPLSLLLLVAGRTVCRRLVLRLPVTPAGVGAQHSPAGALCGELEPTTVLPWLHEPYLLLCQPRTNHCPQGKEGHGCGYISIFDPVIYIFKQGCYSYLGQKASLVLPCFPVPSSPAICHPSQLHACDSLLGSLGLNKRPPSLGAVYAPVLLHDGDLSLLC